jgi:uncharacterized protein YndB with AHSA1/START domain
MHRFVAGVALASAFVLVPVRSAHAEVIAAEANGFITRATVSVGAGPEQVFTRFAEIGRWWNDAHTWSGKASNMSIALAPDGCWCEKLPNGGFIEHGRLIYLERAKMLRFRAALGPMHEAAALGTLTVAFEPEQGGKTKLTLTYAAMLFQPGAGAAPLAPLVDQVMTEQVERLKQSFGETK